MGAARPRFARARKFNLAQILVGLLHQGVYVDGATHRRQSRVVLAVVAQCHRQVAQGLRVVRVQHQRAVVMQKRLRVVAKPLAGIAQIVVRLGAVGQKRRHPPQAFQAVGQLARLLQDDAQIIPALRRFRRQSHCTPRRALRLGQRALLAADFRQVAVKAGGCKRRLASDAQVLDRHIGQAIGMRHQAQQVPRIGLVRRHGQYPQAELLGLWRLARVPVRIRLAQRGRNGQRRDGGRGLLGQDVSSTAGRARIGKP
ncbi:hypothetical protein D3C73_1118320 [compost metagenome]